MTQTPTLPWRDTARVYGRVTRLLHWAIAAMILWQFLGMALRLIFGRQPFVGFFVGSHQMVGTALFLLILARVLWALANRANRPAHGHGTVGLAARLGHFALYAVMLIVPTAAILRALGGTRPFAPFGFTISPGREQEIGWMVATGNLLHGELAWVLAALVAGHVLMVGLHEGMWRDGTLARMAGRRGLRNRA